MKFLIFVAFFSILPSASQAGPWACPDGKRYPVSLTFDDGPKAAFTPKVLDVLKSNNIKATFFISAFRLTDVTKKAENYEILNRIKREGHVIGSHSYEHFYHARDVSLDQAEANILKAKDLLKGYENPILRLPYGDGAFSDEDPAIQAKNDAVMDLVKKHGYSHVFWDIDTNDWDLMSYSNIIPSMMQLICEKKGGIILMHDIEPNTVEHLQEWITVLQNEGHPIVPLSCFEPTSKSGVENRSKPAKEICAEFRSLSLQAAQMKMKNLLDWLANKF